MTTDTTIDPLSVVSRNESVSSETSRPTSAVRESCRRCFMAALIGAVVMLSVGLYEYRHICSVLQRAIDQQNVLLDHAVGVERPTDPSSAF